ncbi:hypothetical protein KSS87_011079 [Heliosperma pusillum]|nr:hypothetical protein KSS87_011079 [Heliosperma pusillum]
MKTLNLWIGVSFCISALIIIELVHVSKAQSSSSEQRILLQTQQQLEYPDALKSWQKWTDFCFPQPTSSVIVVCSNGHVTELTVIGNKTTPYDSPKLILSGNLTISQQTLSQKISIDSLFTVLTKLTRLKKLSLVSLGIWGTLPAKIDRFKSLEMLNISSNFIYGEISKQISSIISLKSLVLANNLINESVPDLSSLTNLEELDLSNNQIGPNFPTLGTNLISIILRNNSIRSPIPIQMENMNKIQRFDVSSNNLVGPIPPFVLSIPSLWYLNLADNQLTGEFPENTGCGKRLWFVDISKNLLIGKLPKCIGSDSSKYRKTFSDWNCLSGLKYQHPVRFCERQAIAVIPPAKKGSTVEKQRVSGVKLGLIFGVIGGTILILGTVSSLIWVFCKRTNSDKSVAEKLPTRPSPIIETTNYVARSMRMPTIGLPPFHSFSIEELEEATNNFDQVNLVAEASQGQVYKGLLPSGSAVLIKCIKSKEKHSIKSLKQHMEIISQLRHPNLSSVVGHCVMCQDRRKGSTIYVVVEHVANGSLREHLVDWRRKDRLKWPQRMTISMGIAKGVHFLHTGMVPGVLGNDLKMENILLDDSLTPKLSNYKIPLPFKLENPNGEKVLSSENSEKEDIYQMGVIMLELLTGKQLESSLAESATTLQKTIDLAMRGTFAYQSVKTAAQITVSCLCKDPTKRPPMEDVVWHLQYSIQAQQAWTTSGNLALNSGNLGLHK